MKKQLQTNISLMLGLVAIVLVLMAAPQSARSQNMPCPGVQTLRVTYLPTSGYLYTNARDARTDPNDPTHEVKLRGSLHFKQVGTETIKNRPVLIFTHGHEKKRGEACAIVSFFVAQKWVVFMPLRRGHFLDANDSGEFESEGPDIRSTGIHVDDYVNLCERPFSEADSSGYLSHLFVNSGHCRPGAPLGSEFRRSGVELGYLNEQRLDIRDQITYIKSLPAFSTEVIGHNWKLADANNIVVLGHSYGGALTVLTNAYDYGQSVAVDISGAELSWGNDDEPYWRLDLSAAMEVQQRPIYLFQPKNGRYLRPTKNLFTIGVDNEFRVQAAIFPPAPCLNNGDCSVSSDPDWKQSHVTFIGLPEQVAKWGPSVVEFAKRYPRQ